MNNQSSEINISRQQALEIADKNIKQINNPNLVDYEIECSLEKDGWHVIYMPEVAHGLGGGGLYYIIDTKTGNIISKTYQR